MALNPAPFSSSSESRKRGAYRSTSASTVRRQLAAPDAALAARWTAHQLQAGSADIQDLADVIHAVSEPAHLVALQHMQHWIVFRPTAVHAISTISCMCENFTPVNYSLLLILKFLFFSKMVWNCLTTPPFPGFLGEKFEPLNVVCHRVDSKTSFARPLFSTAMPLTSNSLPSAVLNCDSLSTFRSRL